MNDVADIPDWGGGACRAPGIDPELFFPGQGEDARPAKLICDRCPIKRPCLEYALANGERFGIWGGTSQRERRVILRDRRRGAA